MMSGQALRYLLVGGANTAVGYGTILLLQLRSGWSPVAANAAGFAAGLLVSYVLNRRYTFRSDRRHRTGVPLFAAAAAVCYGLNLVVLQIASSMLTQPPAIAQALAVCAYMVSFYAANRLVVFRTATG